MKALLLTLVFLGAALIQAQAQFRDDQIVHDLGDDGVAAIAKRLGLRHQELGMGGNQLGRGRYAFMVSAPDAGNEGGIITTAQRREQALVLSCSLPKKRCSPAAIHEWNSAWSRHFSTADADDDGTVLTAKLFLVDGVTFRTVLEHVRRFHREVRAFDAGPASR